MVNKIGLVGGGQIGGVLLSEIVSRGLAREVGLVISNHQHWQKENAWILLKVLQLSAETSTTQHQKISVH